MDKKYKTILKGGLWKADDDKPDQVLNGSVQSPSEIEKLKEAGEEKPYSKAKKYKTTVFKNEDAKGNQPAYNLVISEVQEVQEVQEDDDLPF